MKLFTTGGVPAATEIGLTFISPAQFFRTFPAIGKKGPFFSGFEVYGKLASRGLRVGWKRGLFPRMGASRFFFS